MLQCNLCQLLCAMIGMYLLQLYAVLVRVTTHNVAVVVYGYTSRCAVLMKVTATGVCTQQCTFRALLWLPPTQVTQRTYSSIHMHHCFGHMLFKIHTLAMTWWLHCTLSLKVITAFYTACKCWNYNLSNMQSQALGRYIFLHIFYSLGSVVCVEWYIFLQVFYSLGSVLTTVWLEYEITVYCTQNISRMFPVVSRSHHECVKRSFCSLNCARDYVTRARPPTGHHRLRDTGTKLLSWLSVAAIQRR